jgi:hypothetical protein
LFGKVLYKNDKTKLAIESLERCVKVQVEENTSDEKPKANTFYFLGKCFEK